MLATFRKACRMIANRTARTLRATAKAIEENDTLWRFFVATFLLAMGFIAYEAAAGLSFLLTLGRR